MVSKTSKASTRRPSDAETQEGGTIIDESIPKAKRPVSAAFPNRNPATVNVSPVLGGSPWRGPALSLGFDCRTWRSSKISISRAGRPAFSAERPSRELAKVFFVSEC